MVLALVELVHRLAGFKVMANQNASLLKLGEHAVDGGESDVDAVGQTQIPAPLADEDRGLGHRVNLRIARQQREEIARAGFGDKARALQMPLTAPKVWAAMR